MIPFVSSIFVGGPKTLRDDKGDWVSSIARARVPGPIKVGIDGLEGDKITQQYHGGPDAALCVHLSDHYEFWRNRYGISFEPGYLGENLVLDGITEAEICAGDKIRIGSALVQVSGPRIPCRNQARRAGRLDWVKRTIQENRTGFYLRVLEPGALHEGDAWGLLERSNERASIVAINRCMYLAFDAELAAQFAQTDGLADWWRQQFLEKLERRQEHWSQQMTE